MSLIPFPRPVDMPGTPGAQMTLNTETLTIEGRNAAGDVVVTDKPITGVADSAALIAAWTTGALHFLVDPTVGITIMPRYGFIS